MEKQESNFEQIILIGPARSGTKILRDTIATHPKINKIEFDINFIWKRHNEEVQHDSLASEKASPKVVKYIRKYFKSKAKNADFVIEKTVSNTLRIPFVRKVFPKAKYIFLFRNGMDAVESVNRQWGIAPKGSYLFKKFMSVPFLDVIPYIITYAWDLIRIKLQIKPTEAYIWGVKYPNFEEDLAKMSTLEFCAHQWNHCVEAMLLFLTKYPEEDFLIIRYEDFVEDPQKELNRVSQYLNLPEDSFNSSNVYKRSVGTAKNNLNNDDFDKILRIIGNNLNKLNYNQ